jgi:hypothetical protein
MMLTMKVRLSDKADPANTICDDAACDKTLSDHADRDNNPYW